MLPPAGPAVRLPPLMPMASMFSASAMAEEPLPSTEAITSKESVTVRPVAEPNTVRPLMLPVPPTEMVEPVASIPVAVPTSKLAVAVPAPVVRLPTVWAITPPVPVALVARRLEKPETSPLAPMRMVSVNVSIPVAVKLPRSAPALPFTVVAVTTPRPVAWPVRLPEPPMLTTVEFTPNTA